jgi:hypothetical protein
MHLLPLSLGRLAEHADRSLTPRFATNAVLLRVQADNTFEAVATDSKTLVRVTGPCAGDPAAFPDIPEFATRPDGCETALVPADFWKSSFAWAKKLTRMTNPELRCIAVKLGATETSFAAAGEGDPWVDSAENVTGRYPNHAAVLDALIRKPAADAFAADPKRLAELARTAAEFSANADDPRVEVETRGAGSPVLLRAGAPGGVEFVGLVMPLFAGAPPADLARLCAELQAERDALARQVEELKTLLGRANK